MYVSYVGCFSFGYLPSILDAKNGVVDAHSILIQRFAQRPVPRVERGYHLHSRLALVQPSSSIKSVG